MSNTKRQQLLFEKATEMYVEPVFNMLKEPTIKEKFAI